MFTQYNLDALLSYCRALYGDKNLLLTPQIYSAEAFTVAAGAFNNGNIQIPSNADFIMLSSAVASADFVAGKILFADSGSGEQFSNAPVYVQTYCTGQDSDNERTFHYPRYIGGNSSVTYSLQNVGSAPATDVIVSIIGFNVREM